MTKPSQLPTRYRSVRTRALAAGQHTYQGQACPHCQTKERYVANQRCVDCSAAGRTYYSRNSEEQKIKMRAASREKWKNNRELSLWQSAKWRAKKYGREFNLSVSDIKIPEFCPVLGIPMTSPSLDRKNNDLGYVKGNVFVISNRANTLKGHGTVEELEAIIRYMKE